MKELQAIEKLEFVKATFERLGLDFSKVTVAEAFEMYIAIKGAVSDTLANQLA